MHLFVMGFCVFDFYQNCLQFFFLRLSHSVLAVLDSVA